MIAGRRLRPGAAARRRRGSGRRGRRAGDVHPPARGDGPAHVLPGRAPRDSASRSSRASTTRRWRRASGERYGIAGPRDGRSASSSSGPRMIETGAMMGAEESGGYGFGMHLPERDGVYADLLLLDLFLREKAAGRWPVSRRSSSTFHEHRRAVVLPPDRRPRRPGRLRRRSSAGCSSTSSREPPTALAGRAGRADPGRSTPNDGSKFFVADGSWLLVRASGHRAPRPRLHRGDVAGARGMRWWPPASTWSAAHDRRDGPRPVASTPRPERLASGRQAVGLTS